MKKRTILTALCLILALLTGLTGTLAYLTDTESDVNVMTLGDVKIEQLEYERVTENGAWVSAGEADKYGYTPDKVQPFTQGKPLYPAYFADGVIKWDDRNGSENATGAGSHQQSWGQVNAPGSNQLFDDSVYGALDKFVFVRNTGKADAYVRTWFALEQGSVAAEDFNSVIKTNGDKNHWSWETVAADVVIDGNTYVIAAATYVGPGSNPNGVLPAGEVSYPSLLQVYMLPEATAEDVAAIDGNGNGTYDILVLTQATQTANFPDAGTALDASFGEVSEDSIPWESAEIPNIIYTVAQLKAAAKAGGNYVLGADLLIDGASIGATVSGDMKLDLNNHDITMNSTADGYAIFYVNGGDLTITGEGNVSIADGYATLVWATNSGSVDLYGGNWFESSDDLAAGKDPCEGIYGNKTSVINIYGGTYSWDCNPDVVLNLKNGAGSVITVYGGSFEASPEFIYGKNDDSFLAPGCTLVESTDADGSVWQTVVMK